MGSMTRRSYLLITEAMGEALAEVLERDSPLLADTGRSMVKRVGRTLKADNPAFDQERFVEGVEATAKLYRLQAKGVDLG